LPTQTLQSLFIEQIRDLYDAEKQLTKALPKLVKAANTQELANALSEHLEQTHNHVTRLEKIFATCDAPAKGKPCKAMKGLIEEGAEAIGDHKHEGALRDLAMIAAAQKVEHYEVSGYGTARTMAEQLENREAAQLLNETEDEERKADETLTRIAMSLYGSVSDKDEDNEDLKMGVASEVPGGRRSMKRSSR
jgi:ferritin-like metal-binding protein YciE